MHTVLNHEGYLPCFAAITDGKTSDVAVGRTLKFDKGTIAAMDKGYVDFKWWKQMGENGVYFVTRLREDLVARIRQQQFVYRDLYPWLNDPFQAPPVLQGVHDGQLAFGRRKSFAWTADLRPAAENPDPGGKSAGIGQLIGTAEKRKPQNGPGQPGFTFTEKGELCPLDATLPLSFRS